MNQLNLESQHNEIIGPFAQEPQPDIFVMIRNKIIPLHLAMLKQSAYFSKLNFGKSRIHIIEENLDIKSFVFILEKIYGKKQRFPTDRNLMKILEVLQYLECQSIIEQLCQSIHTNFEDIGFFLVLQLVQRLQIDELLLRCYNELLLYNFEHIIINKIDLYDYDLKSFLSILRKHRLLQQQNIIDGIPNSQILRTREEYSQIHNLTILDGEIEKHEQAETVFLEIMKELKFSTSQFQRKILRKRSKTWDVPSVYGTIIEDAEDSASTGSPTIQEKIEALTNLNNQMQQKSKSLIEQIHEVKSLLSKKSEPITQSTLDENELEEKFHQIEIQWEKQEQKYMGIVKKLKTYNQSQQKNKRSSLLSQSSITRQLSLDSNI